MCERPLPVVNRYTTVQAKASESFVHTACAATHRQPHKQCVLMRGYPCFRFAEHGVCYSESVCVCGRLGGGGGGGCLHWYKSKEYCTCNKLGFSGNNCLLLHETKPNQTTFAYFLVCLIWPVFLFCLAYLLLLQSPYFFENLFVFASYLSVSLNAVYLLASSLSSQPAWKVMCTGKLNERHPTITYMWVLHLQDIMGVFFFLNRGKIKNWGYCGMENEIQ